jgi:PHP family Zn ribbon phosphoesterase
MTEAEHLREENARLRGLMIPAHAVAPDTSSNASGITFPYLKYVKVIIHLDVQLVKILT